MSSARLKPVLAAILLIGVGVGVGCGEREEAADPATVGADPTETAASAVQPGPKTGAAPDGDSRLGPALDHPERYYGVYAAPDRPGREWFIAEAKRPAYAERAPQIPPGHLMLGAMFGDVAPWPLKTLSETEFVQPEASFGQSEPIAVEFRLGDGGRAEAFRFTGGSFGNDSWLERTGDLPEGW